MLQNLSLCMSMASYISEREHWIPQPAVPELAGTHARPAGMPTAHVSSRTPRCPTTTLLWRKTCCPPSLWAVQQTASACCSCRWALHLQCANGRGQGAQKARACVHVPTADLCACVPAVQGLSGGDPPSLAPSLAAPPALNSGYFLAVTVLTGMRVVYVASLSSYLQLALRLPYNSWNRCAWHRASCPHPVSAHSLPSPCLRPTFVWRHSWRIMGARRRCARRESVRGVRRSWGDLPTWRLRARRKASGQGSSGCAHSRLVLWCHHIPAFTNLSKAHAWALASSRLCRLRNPLPLVFGNTHVCGSLQASILWLCLHVWV